MGLLSYLFVHFLGMLIYRTELKITNPAFVPEGWIPNRHSGFGEDISPELHIEGIIENAVSMVITLDDLGHPIQLGYNH